jgi:hypothetical protein
MPILTTNKKQILDIITFNGFDNSPMAQETTLFNTKNIGANDYPNLSQRSNREVVSTISATALFATNTKLCYVIGTNFYYDGVIKGTVTTGSKSMVDINGSVVIFPDKKYYDYVLDTFGSFTAPDIIYATVWNNRVWGVYGQQIVASKLGDFKSWSTFEGLASDSYATNVDGSATFTGLKTYQNHL